MSICYIMNIRNFWHIHYVCSKHIWYLILHALLPVSDITPFMGLTLIIHPYMLRIKGKFSIRYCRSIPTWVWGHDQHLVGAFWFLTQANMLPHAIPSSLPLPWSSRGSSLLMCSSDCVFVLFGGFLVSYVFFPFLSNFWNYFLIFLLSFF